MILASLDAVVPGARLAEMMLEIVGRLAAQVFPRFDSQPGHLLRRHRTYAMEALDRQVVDKGLPSSRRHDELTVEFALIRRPLCQELVVGTPAEAGSPVSSRMRARTSSAVAVAVGSHTALASTN